MGYLHTGVIPFMSNEQPAGLDREEQALADALWPNLDWKAQAKVRNLITVPWVPATQNLPGAERAKFVIMCEWFDGWVVQRDVKVISWLNDSPFWNDHPAKLLMAVFCPNATDTQQALDTINENLKRLSKKIKNGDKHWKVRLSDLSTCQVWEWAYGKAFRPIEMK